MNKKILSTLFYVCAVALIGLLFFFIIYNAEWLIGDDSIIIGHTGWSHPFHMSDTIIPSIGRFFPFAYLVYNILWLLGLSSIQAHFSLVAIVFVLSCAIIMILATKSIRGNNSPLKYVIYIAFLLIGVQRVYANHLDLYSCVWFSYFLILLFCISCIYVHLNKSVVAAVIGFLSSSYLCYSGEVGFLFPLCYGTAGLIINWKKSSKLEKIYLLSLVSTAILFLILYAVIILPHIEKAYLGDHGENVSFIGNAYRQLIAQKILWLGLLILCYRVYVIFVKKEPYEFWDSIILAGFGYCIGCAILKLNWVLYYSCASLFMLPAITHYITKCLGVKWSAIILSLLALFMCRKMPQTIISNQKYRNNTTVMMNVLHSEYAKGEAIYWFEPNDNRPWCFDIEQRAFLRNSLQTQIGWVVGDEHFKLNIIDEFAGHRGVYVLPLHNNTLFPGFNDKIAKEGDIILNADNISEMIVVRITD